MNPDNANAAAPADAANPRRKRLLLALSGLFAATGIAYGTYWALFARHVEKTDDAYVAGNVVQITPRTAGTVLAIHADDTDFVRSGESLVELDQADAKLALDHAQAQLAQTVREVRTLFATSNALSATTRLREADVAKARDDLARRQALAGSGAVSGEEIEHARTALAAATAALAASQEQYASNHALIDNATVEQHPRVLAAAAQVREAWLAYERTEIPAPVSGYVAKRAVQVGQRIAPGAPLMAVIPLDQVWVDANFKEGQLQRMRIGQPVTLTSDVYGSHIEYHGKVAGLAAGTGSAFALLPAQNATGNWIKVVQRVPVRIALDPAELGEHPLRVGLSMQVDVDVHDQSGKQLAEGGARQEPIARTEVFSGESEGADALVKQIIATNLHGAPAQDIPPLARRGDSADASARVAGDVRKNPPLIRTKLQLAH
ncbi:efflux RND transporter periplasmic adaptor subunit [Azoarcus sp. KH32C]|uniref:HlyD family secretion protein n=1 Tax=Azoarcus sp. KH32C TaxID=748247 RepID=UPI0002386C46|nr:efflux RND transporter periplasmic adaptor subunit [Azoarcus sp. KH32C]BAL23842.1 multidrug resistance protein A [Azoarcus sp. KH32C]